MKSACVLIIVFVNVWAVSAISWKNSISRNSTDVLRRRYRDQKNEKFSTVFNLLKPSLKKDPVASPQFFELPLDHFGNTSAGTITTRYYVQSNYYKPGGPVILHDIGESSVAPYAPGLVDEEDFTVAMTKRFNGILILFEHRFYGESAPKTNVSQDFSKASKAELTEYYKYHTIEQALEDVVVFANNFTYNLEDYPGQDLTPQKTPWVFIGVSYSGARGAWLAKRNPGLFKATLASSAPVELSVDFWEYFAGIQENLADTGYRNCSADLHAAASWMTNAYQTRNETLVDQMISTVYQQNWDDRLKQYSNLDDTGLWDLRRDYLQDAAWTPFADFQYYGVQGGTLGKFCKIMEAQSGDATDGAFAVSLEDGVAAYSKALAAISPSSYSKNSNKRGLRHRKRQSGTLDKNIDNYSWLWQVCTEFGAFQVANQSQPLNMLPSFINVTGQIDQCMDTFGESEQVNAAGPNIDPINQKYSGWNLELSNTLWTNGQYDPWRGLSVASSDAPANETGTTSIPQCGSSFPQGTQLRYTIAKGYHGSEFTEDVVDDTPGINPTNTIGPITATRKTAFATGSGTRVVDASNAQSLWFSAMSSWLPCSTLQFTFTPPASTSSTPFSSRPPYPTDNGVEAALQTPSASSSSISATSSPDSKKNAGAPLVIPTLIIPFIISVFAFLASIRIV
ncbi:hypothetical protein TWF694_011258 [Orbilia ellipsospora]|uniref:Serine carboxypeptidase S28-domain-containing protein n=1 Tax=Orbilia ellipsospora TaxID=2528407 RepID=A0AAV9X8Z7_9PEZI